jgi:hypothetical protein
MFCVVEFTVLVYGVKVQARNFSVACPHPVTKKAGGGWGIPQTKNCDGYRSLRSNSTDVLDIFTVFLEIESSFNPFNEATF